MSEVTLQVNPKASLEVMVVGEEKTPVIIIDDFAVDTKDIIELLEHSLPCSAEEFENILRSGGHEGSDQQCSQAHEERCAENEYYTFCRGGTGKHRGTDG